MAPTHHYVLVTDENGIADAYQDAKKRLVARQHDHVSLIFFTGNSTVLFARELSILHSHFPERFLIYEEGLPVFQPGITPQETLESVINENTRDVMSFLISGDAVFTDLIRQFLAFLGIQSDHIRETEEQ